MSFNSLVTSARNGDTHAEEQLFGHLSVRFRRLATRRVGDVDDAEEIVQEALAAIAKDYKEIEYKRSFGAWAHKVLENRILNYFSTKKRREKHFERNVTVKNSTLSTQAPAYYALIEKLLDCLRKIGKANIRYARILNLHHQGYSTTEIAEKLHITADNFYMILSRSRSLLQYCLETGGIDR